MDKVKDGESGKGAPRAEGVTAEELVADTAALLQSLGRAVVHTVQDVTQLMVVRTDAEMREKLDLLVDAGVVKSRRAGARTLIKEGLEAKQPLFSEIERTQARIAALKGQLRSLVTVKAGE